MPAEIAYGDTVSVSLGMTALIVDVINLAEKLLARQNGQPLPMKLREARDLLDSCLARAAADADATRARLTEETVLAFEHDPVAAAKALGISASGVRSACRAGRLGRKVGDRWLISEEDIEMYRQNYLRGAA